MVGLETLEIAGASGDDEEGRFVMRDSFIQAQNLASLTSLSLSFCDLSKLVDLRGITSFTSLTSLTLENIKFKTTESFCNIHDLFSSLALTRLSFTDLDDTMGYDDQYILRQFFEAVAPPLSFIKLDLFFEILNEMTDMFSEFGSLQELETGCTPYHLDEILSVLSSRLSSLTLFNIWEHAGDYLIFKDHGSIVLSTLDYPSMKDLRELRITDVDQETFLKGVPDGEVMIKEVEGRGIVVLFKG